MALSSFLAVLAALQLSQAAPAPVPYNPLQPAKRQSPEGAVTLCVDNACDDCRVAASTGPGFPTCFTYNSQDTFGPHNYPRDQNGLWQVYVNVPPLDPGCSVIVRSPVFGTACAGTDLVAQGETCAPIRFDSSFSLFFCCGANDCNAVGVPRRDVAQSSRNPFGVFNTFGSLMLHDMDGTALVESAPIFEKESKPVESEPVVAVAEASAPVPQKRQSAGGCDGFVPFMEPFIQAGAEVPVSSTITCGAGGTQPCQIRADRGHTENFSVTGNFGISGAFDLITASANIQWQESNSRTFGETFGLDPGTTGYIAFVPRLTCQRGQFIGPDCSARGVEVTGCAPSQGVMEGNVRLVQVRG